MKNDNRPRAYRKDTLLTHLGRNPEAQHGAINPPVYHASTILSKNIAEWENRPDPRTHFGVVGYGLSGTPTTFALEELLAKIEGGYRAAIVCSGLAAITAPLQGLLSQGDPYPDGRLRLWPGAQFLQPGADPHGRRDDLLRAADRGRHRPADAAQHEGRLCRVAGLADIRGAGRAGDRRSRGAK